MTKKAFRTRTGVAGSTRAAPPTDKQLRKMILETLGLSEEELAILQEHNQKPVNKVKGREEYPSPDILVSREEREAAEVRMSYTNLHRKAKADQLGVPTPPAVIAPDKE